MGPEEDFGRLSLETMGGNIILDVGSPAGTMYWSVFQYACAIGDVATVRECLKTTTGVVVSDPQHHRDGYQSVHITARYGQTEIMKLLLDHSFYVNAVDHHGFTPLHYATLFNHRAMVQLLVSHGASPDLQSTTGGISSIDLAQEKHYMEILAIFETVSKIGRWF